MWSPSVFPAAFCCAIVLLPDDRAELTGVTPTVMWGKRWHLRPWSVIDLVQGRIKWQGV